MRLLNLRLDRYGPFTGQEICFRPDARLHLVVGRNEAGKSSALAAVTDLLFGIEERTRFAFLHAGTEMRIGADIVSRDGQHLSLLRRKGRKRTLLDASGAELPDDCLTPYLGGLTRAVFCRAFGLDANMLREGGREMLRSDGEIGAALLTAASGLRSYTALQRELEGEASEIFTPRARDRVFQNAVARFKAAHDAVRMTRLGADAWRELNEGLEQASLRLATITERRAAIASETARLRRLQRVAPILLAIDGLDREMAAFADLADVADHDLDALVQADGAAAADHAIFTRASEAEARAIRALAETPPIGAHIAHADAILTLYQGVEGYRTLVRDLPRVTSEADAFLAELERLAARIGRADPAALKAGLPSDAARARVDEMIKTGRRVIDDVARLDRELAARQDDLRKLQASREPSAVAIDPSPLRSELDALAPVLREADRRDDLALALAKEQNSLASAARRLTPAADIRVLTQAALPGPETVQRYARLYDGLDKERARTEEHLREAVRLGDDIAAAMHGRAAHRPVPDRADLLVLRAERDVAWATVRAAAFAEKEAPIGAALAGAVTRFERASHQSDSLADDLASEAQRAAEQAADKRRLETAQSEAIVARGDLDRILAQAEALGQQWAGHWAVAGIAPLPPTEMAGWLNAASLLIERDAQSQAKAIEHAALAARVEAARAPLVKVLQQTDDPVVADGDVSLLFAAVDERIGRLERAWDTARETEMRVRSIQLDLAETTRRAEDALSVRAGWEKDWQAGIGAIGLASDAALDEADAALAAWRDVPAALAGYDNRCGRVTGITRDIAQFETQTRLVFDALQQALDRAPVDAVTKLHDELLAARANDVRQTDLARRVAEAAADRSVAAENAGRSAAVLGEALQRAGIIDSADRTRTLAGLTARRNFRAAAGSKRADLALAGDGVDETTLRRDLAAVSIDEIGAHVMRLGAEDQQLDLEGKEVFAERSRLAARRDDLSGGMGAELAAARRSAAEAEIHDAARRYIVLKLGALMLGSAVDSHRAQQEDPLIARAGALFSGLTGGAFADLLQIHDETDTPILAGRRRDSSRPVPIDGMSEGTRDQLYLALRLAYLESYARQAEPAPFVGDDIFATFDDARTGHGLAALAAIGDTVQPILFTHHEHVAEIARQRIGGALDTIRLN